MAVFWAGVLPLFALTWRWARSARSQVTDVGAVVLPAITFTDAEIESALQDLMPPSGSTSLDLGKFVTSTHELYFDSARPSNPYQSKRVPFHNWDHGRNVWSFAQWYVSQTPPTHLNPQEKFLLAIAALSHDVMHPGTPNSAEVVIRDFLPQVQRWSNKPTWTLEKYAGNLLEEIPLQSTSMRAALGCNFKSCEKLTDAQVLTDRSPQEVLHSWITMKLLKDAGLVDEAQLTMVVESILMTSIKAHFDVLYHAGFPPDHAAINSHVKDSKGSHKLGLLLHLFDMGYLCQTKINKETPSIGHTFAARYLIESRNSPGNLQNWANVKKGQMDFGNETVGFYLNDLKQHEVISEDMFQLLDRGKVDYLERIGNIKAFTAIEANRNGNWERLEPGELEQIGNWSTHA